MSPRWPGGPVTDTCCPAGGGGAVAGRLPALCPSSDGWLIGPLTDVLGGFHVDCRQGGGSSLAWVTVFLAPDGSWLCSERRRALQPARVPRSLHTPLSSGRVDRAGHVW